MILSHRGPIGGEILDPVGTAITPSPVCREETLRHWPINLSVRRRRGPLDPRRLGCLGKLGLRRDRTYQ